MVTRHVTPIAGELDRDERFLQELVGVFDNMGLQSGATVSKEAECQF